MHLQLGLRLGLGVEEGQSGDDKRYVIRPLLREYLAFGGPNKSAPEARWRSGLRRSCDACESIRRPAIPIGLKVRVIVTILWRDLTPMRRKFADSFSLSIIKAPVVGG